MSKKMSKAFIGVSIGLWVGIMSAVCFGAEPTKDMHKLATCADGKVEYSATGDHRGACSGHGGVVQWADGAPVKSHKPKTAYK